MKNSHRNIYSKKSYKIRDANVRYPFGEIDIVAEQGNILVFIEVRKRETGQWLQPQETLTSTKVARLQRAIQAYLARYKGSAQHVRIDLIAFTAGRTGSKDKQARLRHFENFI